MHTLVAQPERRRDLTQRSAAQVQSPHRAMEVRPRQLHRMLSLDQPLLRLSGQPESSR
jgi:hypothetical protein